MPIVTITFEKCIQDSQDFGSDDEHMVSRVFFKIDISGVQYLGLYCDLKQTVGSDYNTGPIEVGPIQGAKYPGPFKYTDFRDEAEQYYRSNVGSAGSGIRTGSGAENIRMRNNTFIKKHQAQFNWD